MGPHKTRRARRARARVVGQGPEWGVCARGAREGGWGPTGPRVLVGPPGDPERRPLPPAPQVSPQRPPAATPCPPFVGGRGARRAMTRRAGERVPPGEEVPTISVLTTSYGREFAAVQLEGAEGELCAGLTSG